MKKGEGDGDGGVGACLSEDEILSMKLPALQIKAKDMGIAYSNVKKADLVKRILKGNEATRQSKKPRKTQMARGPRKLPVKGDGDDETKGGSEVGEKQVMLQVMQELKEMKKKGVLDGGLP